MELVEDIEEKKYIFFSEKLKDNDNIKKKRYQDIILKFKKQFLEKGYILVSISEFDYVEIQALKDFKHLMSIKGYEISSKIKKNRSFYSINEQKMINITKISFK